MFGLNMKDMMKAMQRLGIKQEKVDMLKKLLFLARRRILLLEILML